ncbi:MAG: hypothetical protein LBO78_00870 [Rickettsiales bacterium]|jgi:tRNA nucleotidyltransferase/poly(A) polymerase|nr:hypothetical protein [Rickettsiales bacterium]
MGFDFLDDGGVKALFSLFRRAGISLYAVGGAVRNGLLGLPAKDVDFATPALPSAAAALLESAGVECDASASKFGAVIAGIGGGRFTITTFRRDAYARPHFPAVRFVESLEVDSRRRDFAMNAVYADGGGAVFDPQGGRADILEKRVVRFIGDADKSVRDDPLRILRYFRFCGEYFHESFDAPSLAACARNIRLVEALPARKAAYEIERLIFSPGYGVIRDVWAGQDISAYTLEFIRKHRHEG